MPETATPTPLSARQEIFCRHIAAGASGAEAARRAGYSADTARQQACRLLTNADICLRIAELAAAEADKRQNESTAITATLDRIVEKAVLHRSYSAAIRALEMKARLAGINGPVPPPALPPEDLAAAPVTAD